MCGYSHLGCLEVSFGVRKDEAVEVSERNVRVQ